MNRNGDGQRMGKRVNRKYGFTLVELMIVLIIMVLLAAIAAPIFTGYTERARRTRLIGECRASVQAAQTLYLEAYGKGRDTDSVSTEQIQELAAVNGVVSNVETDGRTDAILHLTYQNEGTVVYCRTPNICERHGEVFNFEEGSSGGGGESGDDLETSSGAEDDGEENPDEPDGSGRVTLVDTDGNSRVLEPKYMWNKISGSDNVSGKDNVTFRPGDIVSDGVSTYIFANTQAGLSTKQDSMEKFISENQSKFVKLDNQTILLSKNLTSGTWVEKGTVCWDQGNYYVAVEGFSIAAYQAGTLRVWPWNALQ